MDVTLGLPEEIDPKKLSDKELIRRFCPAAHDHALAEEVWRRFQPAVYEALEKSSRGLCPAFYDRRDLIHDSYLQARKNLIARICRFRKLDSTRSLRTWLGLVARSTMMDERRKVTYSRRKEKIIEVSIEPASAESEEEGTTRAITEETLLELPELAIQRKVGPVDFDEPFVPSSHYLYFRSRYSTNPIDPASPVERGMIDRQRKTIFREILTQHAEHSSKDATCAALIRLRYWRKWPVAKLVEHFYGKPEGESQRVARHKAYYRLLDSNYQSIVAMLRRRVGVTRPAQI